MNERAQSLKQNPAGAVDLELQWRVEQFLYAEAEMLDERRLEEWYELLADDLFYSMPVQNSVYPNDVDETSAGRSGFSGDYFDEDKPRMLWRIKKALSGRDHIERPASKLRHLVSNVRIRPLTDVENEYEVSSYFVITRLRHNQYQDIYTGKREDLLRRADNAYGFQVARRVITLDQTVLLGGGIGFFF